MKDLDVESSPDQGSLSMEENIACMRMMGSACGINLLALEMDI